jgi:hypothetical protein
LIQYVPGEMRFDPPSWELIDPLTVRAAGYFILLDSQETDEWLAEYCPTAIRISRSVYFKKAKHATMFLLCRRS